MSDGGFCHYCQRARCVCEPAESVSPAPQEVNWTEVRAQGYEPVAAPQEVKRDDYSGDVISSANAARDYENLKAEYVSLREELDKANEKLEFIFEQAKVSQVIGACEVCAEMEESLKNDFPYWKAIKVRAESAESQVADMRKALNRLLERMDYIEKNWSGTIDVGDIKVELEYDEAREALGK